MHPAREPWHCHTSHAHRSKSVALPHIPCIPRENHGTATHPTCARESTGNPLESQALVGMPASRIVGSANR